MFLRKIRARITSIPSNFSWFYEDKVAASGFPASREQLRWIEKKGIRKIITLTEYPIPEKLRTGFSIEFVHIPIRDHTEPTSEQLLRAAREIQESVNSNKRTLVHCLAGQGRTGTVLAAWLVLNGMSAAEAIKTVRQRRPGSIEQRQETCIHSFEEMLKGGNKKIQEVNTKQQQY